MQNNTHPVLYGDQIDLREIFRVLWSAKKLIVSLSLSFALLCLAVSLILPAKYLSTSVLAPASPQVDGLSRTLSKFGGIASLAGLNVGGADTGEPQVALELMSSWGFIEDFIEKHNLQVPVYAACGWNKQENKLTIDDSLYDQENQQWLIKGSDGELRGPTSWELYEKFSEIFSASADTDAGMVSLSVEHYSPYLAKQWVDLMFTEINSHMQQRKLIKVNNNIEYLQAQIEKTSISHMESVFYTIIEEQIKNKMIAQATPEYTFVTVSRSMVPEMEVGLKPLLIFILGGFFGLFISILLVVIRYNLSISKPLKSQ